MSQFKDIIVKGTLRVLKKIITSALEVDDLKITNKINDVPIVDYITRSDVDNELDNESINPIQNKTVKTALDNSASAMNRAIQTKANKSEVYTKTESDHKICKVVCGKNAGAGWFKIGETICNNGKNTVGVTLIINPTYESSRTSDTNKTVNPTIILTIGARYRNDTVDPDKMIGIKNDIVVKPYDIYGTIFDEKCVYVNYENETLSIYLKTLCHSQAYVITALSGYSSYLGQDSYYKWTFFDTNEPIELPTTGIGVYATDVTKSKYDSANNVIVDTYVIKEEGKSLISESEIDRLANVDNYDDTTVKNDITINRSSIGMSKKNLLPFPQTITKGGIKFTCDTNGYMSASDTSSDIRHFLVSNAQYSVNLKAGKYILSFVSSKVCTNAFGNIMVLASDSIQDTNQIAGIGQTNYVKHTSGSVEFTLDTEQTIYVMSKMFDGVTAVMIRYADIIDDTYEPYQDDLQTQIASIASYNSNISNLSCGTSSKPYAIFKLEGGSNIINRLSARFLICGNNTTMYGDVFLHFCFGSNVTQKNYVKSGDWSVSVRSVYNDNDNVKCTYIIFKLGSYGRVAYIGGTLSNKYITVLESDTLPEGTDRTISVLT